MDKYDASNDHYCYLNSSVLKNKLGIKDERTLELAEREITSISIMDIHFSQPPYDLLYLKNIHASLFSELYDWAGQIRDVNISKGGTFFCVATRIEPEINKIFSRLQREDYLSGLAFFDFVKRLSEYYSDFNMIHPFREGNGRVQRLFFEHLASLNGYSLDWSEISQDEWTQANIDGVSVRYDKLEAVFSRILKL